MDVESKSVKLVRVAGKDNELPNKIKLTDSRPGEATKMTRRKVPATLRFYKGHKEGAKFQYQELQMYVAFRNEQKELDKLTDEEISQKWEKMKGHIQKVKERIMPFLIDVTEARVWAKEMERENRTEEIALELDAAMEQENMDDEGDGTTEHPDLQHLDPDQYDLNNNDGQEKTRNPIIYGRIDVPDENTLREKTRELDENQRKVVDTVVQYCKSRIKARERGNEVPKPEHMMVHGAAGT